MDSTLLNALNEQLTFEFESAHTYMAMAHWLELNDLPGFARWMKRQSDEEYAHAQRIIDHTLERSQAVVLPAVPQPKVEWASPQELVADMLESEKRVTAAIGSLCDVAEKAGDRATQIMLQWFVNEQVEEESVVQALLGRLKLVGDSGVGLLMIDQELGAGVLPGAESGEANA